MNLLVLDDPAALARRGALEFQRLAAASVEQRGCFAVCLSGGSTPKAMFALLAAPEFSSGIDWARVHFFWGDERCVPPGDPNSNFAMAKRALLDPIGAAGDHVHRMRGELEPHAGAVDYCAQLGAFFSDGVTRLDLIYLGLGPDGHTASLFPGTAALAATGVPCVANRAPSNVAVPWRLTLTYPALNAGRAVVFLVEGTEKADTVARVVEGPREPAQLPAQGVSPVDGTLTWMVDRAAASKLRRS